MNSGAETPPERPLKTIEGAASFIPRFQYEVLFDIFLTDSPPSCAEGMRNSTLLIERIFYE